MQTSSVEDSRNVIPRWRSPLALADWEIGPARDLKTPPITVADFADQLALWRTEGTLAAAVDIYDTGILVGDKQLQLEGIGPILANAKDVPEKLLDSVRRSLSKPRSYIEAKAQLSALEQDRGYLRATIRLLKSRVVDHPLDVVSILELARLYVLLGQVGPAEKFIRRAIALAPNSRTVLRAAVQYYSIVGSLGEVLPSLWDSEASRYDPLLQSAEIAAADLAGRGSRFARDGLRKLKGAKIVDTVNSELALAVATVENNAGLSQRKVFQLVRAGLPHGTENAQAQAVWLGEHSDRGLKAMLPDVQLTDDAFEARTLALVDNEDYEAAVTQARMWLLDQPFEVEPVNILCNTHAIYLQRPKDVLDLAVHYNAIHNDNWTVQNSTLLIFIRSASFERAKRALGQLERLAVNPTIRAFSAAAAGMLAFAQGRIDLGRHNYQNAINEARTARRPDLMFSAAVFWVIAEATSGSITVGDLEEIDREIAVAVRRLPADNRDYATKLWRNLSKQARSAIEENLVTVSSWSARPLSEAFGVLESISS